MIEPGQPPLPPDILDRRKRELEAEAELHRQRHAVRKERWGRIRAALRRFLGRDH
jgi:hypothetical protein